MRRRCFSAHSSAAAPSSGSAEPVNLQAIREGLKDVISAVPGVRAYDHDPSQIVSSPDAIAVTIKPAAQHVDYHQAFARGLAIVYYTLHPFVAAADRRSAQNQLDALLSSGTDETRSLIDALMTAPRNLAGACADLVVNDVSNVTMASAAPTDPASPLFLTCDIAVRIYVGRT